MTAEPKDPDATLVRLISVAIERRAAGDEPALAEICAERPDLLPAVAEAIGIAERLPVLDSSFAAGPAGIGRVLGGRYRCDTRLGAGSMGVVYRATDLELQRTVAVKVLRSDLLVGPDALQRFERESQLLASIRHRGVVTIHDRGRTAEGEPYFVMELLDGAPLNVLVEAAASAAADGSFARLDGFAWCGNLLEDGAKGTRGSYLRTVVGWVAELATGLQAAHEAGVLHRDVKPSNAFVRRSGAPVLLDFGIAARADDSGGADGTRTLGTAAYLAPEQIERAGPSVRADVYGMTATLYHLVTLRLPYSGTPAQILSQLHRYDPPPARRVRPDLPRDLQAILDCGMARDPARRYATAGALAADLRAFLDHRPIVARPTTWAARVWRRTHRSPAVRGGAFVAFAAAVIVAGVQWRNSERAAQQTKWLDEWSHIAPSLTLWSQRVFTGDRHDAAKHLLDRAADLCVTPVPTRVVRAAFRRDHGDPAGAADDMANVAAAHGSQLAMALERRYRETAAAAPIALDGLPAPVDETDLYLLVFHQLRANDAKAARETLAAGGQATFPPLCELQLALRATAVRSQDTRADGLDVARAAHDDAVRLEARIGRRTAATAHLIAGALIGQGRYEEARPILEEGITLATPAFHGLHSNLAIVERRTGRLGRALGQCRTALALNPNSAVANETLVVVLVDMEDLAGAQEALQQARIGDDVRAGLEARIAYLEARGAWRRQDPDAARTFALRSLELSARSPTRREARHELAFCTALVDGRDVFAATLAAACEDIDDPWILGSLVLPEMPPQLDEAQTVQVRRFLEAWCKHRSPDSR